MEVEAKLSNDRVLNLKLDFDDLVEDYTLQLIESLKRRLSVLDELTKVVDNIDKVVSIMRHAKTEKEAEESLIKLIGIKPFTAERVLNMPLSKLTGLTKEDIIKEKENLISSLRTIQ